MAGVNVKFLRREDRPMSVRAQRSRDDQLRRAREERGYAHAEKQLATEETGKARRTQATGEFGLEQQRMADRAGLRTAQMRQEGETGRTAMREAGETGRLGTREAGLGERQATTIGAEEAAKGRAYGTKQFHQEMGKQAYFGGQDPQAAAQIEQSGQWGTNYQGLKPFEAPTKTETFKPVYSREDVPRLVTPGGTIKDGNRTLFDDEESIKALIAKLKEQKTQGLGR